MKRKDVLNIIYQTLVENGNYVKFESEDKLVYGAVENHVKSIVLLDKNELGFKMSLRVGSFSSESSIETVLRGCELINKDCHLAKITLENIDGLYVLYVNIEYVCYNKRDLVKFITYAEMYLYIASIKTIEFLDNNITR